MRFAQLREVATELRAYNTTFRRRTGAQLPETEWRKYDTILRSRWRALSNTPAYDTHYFRVTVESAFDFEA